MTGTVDTTIVIPTIARASLQTLLESLRDSAGPRPAEIVVVDDRPDPQPLPIPPGVSVTTLRGKGSGPASARNRGWQQARTTWVSFLDDDVVVSADWLTRLATDLARCDEDDEYVAGSAGQVRVPLPSDRRPTDWERSCRGLEDASYITADLSYRRAALAAVGGFDERFPRAYREDADLALRVRMTGGQIVRGERSITHPVREADDWVSLRQQRGNADDALMRVLHGPRWRRVSAAPRGRLPWHIATVLALSTATGGATRRQKKLSTIGAVGWALLTTDFFWRRVAPGPRDRAEVRRLAATSAAIPLAAVYWRLVGTITHRRARPWGRWPSLVLFDRDGTLVHDVPYNGDPDLVSEVDGALRALDSLRERGVPLGVVTNQSAVGRGIISYRDMVRVNDRVASSLGPFTTWHSCPHGPDEGCACRKPAPGMVQRACADVGVDPRQCVVVGDTRADVEAARNAGAIGILVPNRQTEAVDAEYADYVADDLDTAVRWILGRST
ncbi:HAD-IIIA family hydrolase [Epidermidibacterium keratini]|uniref:D,D-heptose 1,7-bisphosphate phosphatase n=1 Tax=Epidermidibacterium keratini TaxID=1891644 RepID=A0A7L4YMW2_9ACTN|nr:HAD-IIIA family hydrolase [Epidermidibacterium keratini]QHC00392.1 HAD-IIIA family hydrolase [Epidermidibacterium keratini]